MSQARFNNLNEWLHWQERCHPSAIDLGLDRIREVAQRMALQPPANTKVITVAGTNGKGTCVAALQGQLRALGYSVGAYTSPHIRSYNERVVINGCMASDSDFCRAFECIDRHRGEISLTYFEFGTLAALYLFCCHDLDYWLLEVGLGGRLDATNIIDADVAVITPIAMDHIEWLGDSREKIALEKVGICRPGQSVVVADSHPPKSLVRQLGQLNCKVSYIGACFDVDGASCWSELDGDRLEFSSATHLPKASIAAAVHVLHRLKLINKESQTKIEAALSNLALAGRFQCLEVAGRTVVLDVAHNAHALDYLCRTVQNYFNGGKCTVVLAMMADKSIAESLHVLRACAKRWCLTTIPELARAAPVESILKHLSEGEAYTTFPSVADALETLLSSDHCDPILITGSFFTVAAATEYLMKTYGIGAERLRS